MKRLSLGISNYLYEKNAVTVSVVASFLLFTLVCLLQNGVTAFQVFSFDTISLSKQFLLFFQTLFDLQSVFTFGTASVAIISSLLGGISIGILYAYYRARGNSLQGGNFAGLSVGYFIALLGIQCVACGTALLTTILTALGGVWLNNNLPYHGLEIGVLGIMIQIMLLISLLNKMAYPRTC